MHINLDPSHDLGRMQQSSETKRGLKDASQQLESLFINQLFQEMRKSVPESTVLGNRSAEKLFESMLDEEISKELANGPGLGLGRMVYQQMLPYVENDDE